MECMELKPRHKAGWLALVDRMPEARLGHDLVWKDIMERCLGHRARYFVAAEGDAVHGILPLFELRHRMLGARLVSVPVLDQGGILADSEPAHGVLIDKLIEFRDSGHYKFIQLRVKADEDSRMPSNKADLILPIPTEIDSLWRSLKPEIRNRVRKAEKKGLMVRVGGAELVSRFFPIYARNMRDLGIPTLPQNLFEESLEAFGERARAITIEVGDEAVGGCAMLFFKGTAAVPWISSSRKHFALCPNNLMYWSAIQMAHDHGCTIFDFGRSSWNSGPFEYKRRWGAVPVPLCWQYYMPNGDSEPEFTTANPKYRAFCSLWQRMPLSVANLLGPVISRQVA